MNQSCSIHLTELEVLRISHGPVLGLFDKESGTRSPMDRVFGPASVKMPPATLLAE